MLYIFHEELTIEVTEKQVVKNGNVSNNDNKTGEPSLAGANFRKKERKKERKTYQVYYDSYFQSRSIVHYCMFILLISRINK